MTAEPVPWGDLPLPPELAEPADGADAWVERVASEAVALADDAALDVDAVAVMLADGTQPVGGGGAPPWTVTDDGSAEWAMRHVVNASVELERLRVQAASWEARINEWFTHRAKPLLAKVAFMEAHLQRYALTIRKADPKRKSLVLPSGVVRTTGSTPKVDIANEARAAAWARQHAPDALQPQEPKLLVSLLRRYVKPVQLLTEAELTFSCGHVMRRDDPDGLKLPDVGTEMECSDHGPVLLGRVEPLATRWVPLCTDGTMAEGVEVDPGGVTAKVVPAP